MRDYQRIVQCTRDQPRGWRWQVLGEVEGYPLINLSRGRDPRLPTVFVMGGTHGDEPAGVEAALAFLNRDLEGWLPLFNFEVIPCLNPYGYVHNTRHNACEVDLNWAYESGDMPEIRIFRQLVQDRRFEFFMDFHEDWESPGYYLYELRRGAPLAGPEITRRVAVVCPLNTSPLIEGHRAHNGCIRLDPAREEERRGEGIPLVLYQEHTDHLLTSESPTGLDMERRVQAHLVALEVVFEAHRNGSAA